MARTAATALRATMPIDETTKRPAARPQPDETLETALKRIRFTPTPKQPAQRPSAYFTETGEAEFQQGATIVPHVLTIAETTSPAARRDRIRVTTRKSSKAPWNTVEPRTIEVPKHWLIDLFSSSTVPSFAARSSRKAIIPMDGDGNLLNEDDITEEGWLLLNDLYTAHAGAGRNTPPTLLQQLANRRKLTAQLPLRRGTRRNLVLCPKSGDIMRAARTHVGSAVADDTLYWYQARTSAEAAYLTVLPAPRHPRVRASASAPRKAAAAPEKSKSEVTPERKRRKMSAAEKKAVSERMTAYWAERKKKAAKK